MKYFAFLKISGLLVFWSQKEIEWSHLLVLALGCAVILTYLCTLLHWGLNLLWNAFAELGCERDCLKDDKLPGEFEEENQVTLRT